MQIQSKKDLFNTLIQKGSVFIHFDGTKTKWVPFHLQSQEHVVFQFGLDLPINIPDIRATDYSLSGTLSFKSRPFFCEVPWNAVYAIVCKDKNGYSLNECLYDKELPLNLRNEIYENDSKELKKTNSSVQKTNPVSSNKKRPSYLRLVK